MSTLAALRREIEIVNKALAASEPQKTIHRIVFIDPETGLELTDCPAWYCYTGFSEKEVAELKKQHDESSRT